MVLGRFLISFFSFGLTFCLFCFDLGVRLPFAIGCPAVLGMKRPGDGENALRCTRLLDVVHSLRLQRHRNGISFVSACVIKLAVDHNCDRHEVRLAIGGEFQQTQCAGPFVPRASLGYLSESGSEQSENQCRRDAESQKLSVLCD